MLFDATGGVVHDSAAGGSKLEQQNATPLDVAVFGESVLWGGSQGEPGLDYGPPGSFSASFDTVTFAGGGTWEVGWTDTVDTAFGASGASALAIAKGSFTELSVLGGEQGLDWSIVVEGQTQGVAVGENDVVVLAGNRMQEGDAAGSFVSAWATGTQLWSVVDESPALQVSALDVGPSGVLFVAGVGGTTAENAVVVARDALGAFLWRAELAGNGGFAARGTSVAATADGGVVLCARTEPEGAALVRYDATGNVVWRRDVAPDPAHPEILDVRIEDVDVLASGRIAITGTVRRKDADEQNPRTDQLLVAVLDP